jgi:hypothetical protein
MAECTPCSHSSRSTTESLAGRQAGRQTDRHSTLARSSMNSLRCAAKLCAMQCNATSPMERAAVDRQCESAATAASESTAGHSGHADSNGTTAGRSIRVHVVAARHLEHFLRCRAKAVPHCRHRGLILGGCGTSAVLCSAVVCDYTVRIQPSASPGGQCYPYLGQPTVDTRLLRSSLVAGGSEVGWVHTVRTGGEGIGREGIPGAISSLHTQHGSSHCWLFDVCACAPTIVRSSCATAALDAGGLHRTESACTVLDCRTLLSTD